MRSGRAIYFTSILGFGRFSMCGYNTKKKPLFHFMPGSMTYSIGSYGCNFTCSNCQNFTTSQPKQISKILQNSEYTSPERILENVIADDCCSVAAPDFQDRYLPGKVVMMGCPKFDDAESYIQRFTEIINTCNLKSITILIMEVPCCSSMNVIVKKALEKASSSVPVEQITISTRGQELGRVTW